MPLPRSGPALRCDRLLLDPWLLGAASLAAGPWLAAEPTAGAATAVALAVLLTAGLGGGSAARGRSRPLCVAADGGKPWRPVLLALALAMLGAARSGAALVHASARYEEARRALDPTAECRALALVSSSPVLRRLPPPWRAPGREQGAEELRGSYDAVVELREAECAGRMLTVGLEVRLSGLPAGLGRGDLLAIVVGLAPLELSRNPGLADPRARVALTGVVGSGRPRSTELREAGRGLGRLVDRARAFVRARIEQSYGPEHAAFARALVLGETDLRDEDRLAFQRSGLAHLLAVSGTHLAITVSALVAALRALLARLPPLAARCDVGAIAAAVGVVAAVAYADFVGGSGSAARAAAMLGVALGARAVGRRPSTARCLAVSLGAAAIVEPLVICDPSFLLSIGATAGLLGTSQAIAARTSVPGGVGRTLGEAVAVTIGATIGCTPVLLCWGVNLPVLGVAANLLGAPLAEAVALPSCLAHAMLWWFPAAEQGAARIGGGALELVRLVAHAGAAPSWAAVTLPPPTAEQLGASFVAVVGLARLATRTLSPSAPGASSRRLPMLVVAALALGSIGLLERAARQAARPSGLLRVTVLDVGQGDALLVNLPNGQSLLIDAGPGPPRDAGRRVLAPLLRAQRRDRVDWLAVSHAHADHAGGLGALLERTAVREVWLADAGRAPAGGDGAAGASEARGPEGSRLLERTLAWGGIRVAEARELCETPRWVGGVRLDVLSPCPGGARDDGDANHRSLVVRLQYGARSALLMADADAAAEQAILDSVARLGPVDLLKVGHHGSGSATSQALLRAAAPRLAAISVGARNRLGHPVPAVLHRLREAGATVWRTDRDGALCWQTDGLRVETRGPLER